MTSPPRGGCGVQELIELKAASGGQRGRARVGSSYRPSARRQGQSPNPPPRSRVMLPVDLLIARSDARDAVIPETRRQVQMQIFPS